MRRMLLSSVTFLLCVGVLPAAAAAPHTVTIDCDRGQTIANALMQGDYRKPLVVNIRGTCDGSVVVDRENVTLNGDGSATLNATDANTDNVTANANGLALTGLTLSGGNFGVRNNQVFDLVITDCVIQDTQGDGVRIFVGDTRLIRTIVQRAGANGLNITRGGSVGASNSKFLDNAAAGIHAENNSTVVANNSVISGNVQGVHIGGGSRGSFSGSTISSNTDIGLTAASSQINVGGSNTIANNGKWGVWVYHGSLATIYGSAIEDNAWDGVAADIGTTLVMNDNQILRNGGFGIACRMNCTMELDSHTLEDNGAGGILIERASKLALIGTVHASGDGWGLQCSDRESSVGDVYLLDGSVSDTCTDFEN